MSILSFSALSSIYSTVLSIAPLILATVNSKKHSKLSYDVYCGDVPKAGGGHPNEEGHKIIANDLLRLL